MPEARRYSEQEVREILERALKGHGGAAGAMTHADLLAIGEQVGVAPEAMARAAEEVVRANADATLDRAIKARRRRWLGVHVAAFAFINGLLFLVNYLTTPGEWWFLFSVFFWGLALAAHAGVALALSVSPSALARERRKLAATGAPPKLRVDGVAEPQPPSELQAAGTDDSVDGLSKVGRAPK